MEKGLLPLLWGEHAKVSSERGVGTQGGESRNAEKVSAIQSSPGRLVL